MDDLQKEEVLVLLLEKMRFGSKWTFGDLISCEWKMGGKKKVCTKC